MIIGSSALQHIVSKAVAHTTLDTRDKDAFANTAMATIPVAPVSGGGDTPAQSGTQDKPTYDEAFAKMMVNLKAAMAGTAENAIDPQAAAATAATMMASADKQVASTDSVVTGTSDSIDELSASDTKGSARSSVGSAREDFLAYMNQTDAEKARQQMTGISKEEYDALSPEQKAAVDKKVAELTKEKAEVAQQEIKARIAMAKSELA